MAQTKAKKSFNYTNVQLKDSHWKQQFDRTKEYYMAIPQDSLLYGFRKRAGILAPGEELGGWYGTGIFHIFGQILSSLSKMYTVTGETTIRDKVSFLVDEWSKCLGSDGYGFYNAKGNVNDVCYEFDKLVGGLTDVYQYTKNKKAENLISRLTDWMIQSDVNRKAGEWYTLAENLYRIYALTGIEKYREFAESFEYMDHWKLYLQEGTCFGVKHAYSHVNSLNSAAMAYAVKRDERYLEILRRAYKLITDKYIYKATGMYGPAEELFDKEGTLGESVLGPSVRRLGCLGNAEVPCETWAAFKLCRYLMEFTDDLACEEWVEKILYNGIGAELPLVPDGKVMYYANYHVYGAYKDVHFDQFCWDNGATLAWPCCAGTYPQAVTEYHNLIYFYDDDGLYISQYLPSRLNWMKDGADISLDMDTKYPEEEEITIRVTCNKPATFQIKLRLPEWMKAAPTLRTNGIVQTLPKSAQRWVTIERQWYNDTISLKIPMYLYFTRVDKYHPHIAALHFGPVVYAALDEGIIKGDTSNPHLWINTEENGNQLFKTVKGHVKGYESMTKRFVPFYKIGPRERYYLYNEIDSVYKRITMPYGKTTAGTAQNK